MEDAGRFGFLDERIVVMADEDCHCRSLLQRLDTSIAIFESNDPIHFLSMERNRSEVAFWMGFGERIIFPRDPVGDCLEC